MRFKTKIILICCSSILLSSIACSFTVYHIVKNNSIDAARSRSSQNAETVISSVKNKMEQISSADSQKMDRVVLEYIFKQKQDEMLICFADTLDKSPNSVKGQNEIFNATVFSQKDLEALQYESQQTPAAYTYDYPTLDCADLYWEGRHFLVYRNTNVANCTIYKLEDISYVGERLRLLGIGLLIAVFVITAIACFVLFLILGKMLQPLSKLNTGAKQIAQGNYNNRIEVEKTDEIGELSQNFNQMAEAVQSRIEELKDVECRKTLFMGNLTHELKTPMTAISGYAKTLLSVKLSEQDAEDALTYIYEESCRLERLSKKLMNLLLLEENESIQMAEVPADTLFYNAREVCQRSLDEDGITLVCRESGETFLADADLLSEVLINLIDNARKASKSGDVIVVAASENRIVVEDFGKGIPEEEKHKILEPFYMIDKSRSRENGGCGLGLAITATILKRHNCLLRIESEVGRGTRMILQFV